MKEDRDGSNDALKKTDSFRKTQRSDHVRNFRKSSRRALRTLFVSGLPQKCKTREALVLHFQKFGEVIYVCIPSNSEHAFVQFSRREEAEAALKAPDAVMGNRFIKLWWANRDKIPNDMRSGSNSLINHPIQAVASQGINKVHSAPPKMSTNTNNATVPSPLQKKLQNLELLNELRRKQETLDQKRNDFKLQLNKLEKQNSGYQNEEEVVQAVKRHKSEIIFDAAQVTTPTSFKRPIRALTPVMAPFAVSKFKLDNRPTAFGILPPLPAGLANVSCLKEHFSSYGELSHVEFECHKETGDHVRVSFTSRSGAENAFKNGKCWQRP